MSAAELRQAAETLRERANGATSGPWIARAGGEVPWVALYDDEDKIPEGVSLPSIETGGSATHQDTAYIATMHPGVGLALADWLGRVADDYDIAQHGYWSVCALEVARLINGGAS